MRTLNTFFALALTACPAALLAQAYPGKPVRFIVPFPPGATPDTVARIIGPKVSAGFGQPVITENRPGSNGNIAAEQVARGAADGHTLLIGQDTLITVNPHMYASMPIDTLKDLAPVSTLSSNRFVLSVNPNLPVKTFAEFVEFARKAKPPLAYASGGNGSQHHLTMEMLKSYAGIDLLHVPFKGGTPAATATAAGETAAVFSGASVAPLLNAGRLRAIAVAGAKRSVFYPQLPAIGEFYPGFDATSWVAMFAPSGTPDAVLERVRSEVNKALAQADSAEKFKDVGAGEPFITTPTEFSSLIRTEYSRYGELVKRLGIRAQ